MAAIPCPQCHRILNLPDDREIERVSCPLCKHAFAPPATPKILPASIPAPRQIIRMHYDPEAEPVPSRPLAPIEEDEDYPVPYKDEDERALESAGGFLKSMAWLGMAHTLPCCGCVGYVALDRGNFGPGAGSGMEEFFAFLIISVVAYTLIWVGARALQLRSSFGLAVTGVAVALLSTSALILINVPVVLSFLDIWTGPVPIMGQPCCGGLLIVPSLLVIVCGLVGGIKGLLALMKPDARELFLRGGERG